MNERSATSSLSQQDGRFNVTSDSRVTEAMISLSASLSSNANGVKRLGLSRDGLRRRRLLRCLRNKLRLLSLDPMAARALPSCISTTLSDS